MGDQRALLMSIRVRSAIGYAMPWGAFFRHTLLDIDPDECLSDELDNALDRYDGLVYQGNDYLWKAIDNGRILPDGKNPSFLAEVIGQGDNQDHVMFWPTAGYKTNWHRFNDDIDYHFAVEGGVEEYLPTGFYPFHDLWMDANGVDITLRKTDDSTFLMSLDPDLRPGVPEVLRWWLLHCGIFDLRGVAALRPMKAQWWG